jgi:hypothetical protein
MTAEKAASDRDARWETYRKRNLGPLATAAEVRLARHAWDAALASPPEAPAEAPAELVIDTLPGVGLTYGAPAAVSAPLVQPAWWVLESAPPNYYADVHRKGPNPPEPLTEARALEIGWRPLYATPPNQEPRAEWRCFHCGETFTEEAAAEEHFGRSERQEPVCKIDAAEYRAMEERMRRYNDEDSDLHRQIYRMQSEHQVALRREEEAGYAKGLRDGRQEPRAVIAESEPSDDEIVAWADGFIREKAFNRPVAIQIAVEAAKWVRAKLAASEAARAEPVAWLGTWHNEDGPPGYEFSFTKLVVGGEYDRVEPLYASPPKQPAAPSGEPT